VAWVTRVAWIPRGIRAPAVTLPKAQPDASEVKDRLRRAVTRHREVGERLAAAERDRLWIGNPFRSHWHYNLPELMRMHAVHVRHHARQVEELADMNAGRNA
jgi:D-aminopeptidase